MSFSAIYTYKQKSTLYLYYFRSYGHFYLSKTIKFYRNS